MTPELGDYNITRDLKCDEMSSGSVLDTNDGIEPGCQLMDARHCTFTRHLIKGYIFQDDAIRATLIGSEEANCTRHGKLMWDL